MALLYSTSYWDCFRGLLECFSYFHVYRFSALLFIIIVIVIEFVKIFQFC